MLFLRRQYWIFFALLSGLVASAWGQPDADHPVQVEGAWARATVAGQQASGVFMQLTARVPLRLVGAQTPVAGAGEIHEMRMDGEVMRMRAIAFLDMPAGERLELKPGSYHVMLLQLRQTLDAGTHIPLTLLFEDAGGQPVRQTLQVPVHALGAAALDKAHGEKHGGGHGHTH